MIPSINTILNYIEHLGRFYYHLFKGIGYLEFSFITFVIFLLFTINAYMIYIIVSNMIRIVPHVITAIINLPYFFIKSRKFNPVIKAMSLSATYDKIFEPLLQVKPGKQKFRDTMYVALSLALSFIMKPLAKKVILPFYERIFKPTTLQADGRVTVFAVLTTIIISITASIIWLYVITTVLLICIDFLSFMMNIIVSLSLDVNEISKEVMIFKWF
ncbi:MAG: hypothetical protein ACRC92_20405 [Peptostreptococcaceae bacterium]